MPLATPQTRPPPSILKESQGIGTPATRTVTIETLKKREYIEVFAIGKGKEAVEYLRCTPKGNDFIRLGPKQMFSVLMTAEWEAELRKMDSLSHAEAFEMRKTFVLRNTQMVTQIVTDVVSALAAAGLSQAPQHGANNARRLARLPSITDCP